MNGKTTIKIEGQEVPLRFAFPCIELFAEACATKKHMFTPGEDANFTTEGFGKLLHCAYLNACEIKEIEPEYDNEAFYDWVSEQQETENGRKVMSEILTIYANSSIMKKIIERNAEQEKKRLTETPIIPLTSTSLSPSSTGNLDGDPGSLQEHASAM